MSEYLLPPPPPPLLFGYTLFPASGEHACYGKRMCGGQMTTGENWFSPTVWISGIKLQLLGLEASAFYPVSEPSCCPHVYCFCFYVLQRWGLNTGPYACQASTLIRHIPSWTTHSQQHS